MNSLDCSPDEPAIIASLAVLGFREYGLSVETYDNSVIRRFVSGSGATAVMILDAFSGETSVLFESIRYRRQGADPPVAENGGGKNLDSPEKKNLKSQRQDKLDEAKMILAHLNTTTGRKFRPLPATLRPIIARLHEGFTSGDCKSVIEKKIRQWGHDPKMQEYLRPATLFCASKFEGYLNAADPAGLVESSKTNDRIDWEQFEREVMDDTTQSL